MASKAVNPSNVIQWIEGYISRHDIDKVKQLVKLLPLAKIDDKTFDSLFVRFARFAYEHNSIEIGQFLITYWDEINDNDDLPYESYIFYLHDLDDPILTWLMKERSEECNSSSHLYNFINYDPSDETIRASIRVINIYGITTLTEQSLRQLAEHAESIENGLMQEFLINKISEVSKPLEKPEWVKNYINSDPLPTDDELLELGDESISKIREKSTKILSTDDATELLTSGLTRTGITTDEMELTTEFIRSFYSGLTNSQKSDLLSSSQITKDTYFMSEDNKLFRYFGPTNILVGRDLSLDEECSKYGGDRMMLCTCFVEPDPDEDLDELDWFVGRCIECGNKIAYKWYALRLPLIHGGWTGCFCSFECLYKQSSNPLQDSIINIMKANIETIGIQDRT
jgi:hypothetical protein